MISSRIWVYSGTRPSNGAKELAAQPGFLRLRDGNYHKIKLTDKIINWGCSAVGSPNNGQWANHAAAVAIAANKLSAFKELNLSDVKTVEWTTDTATAFEWSSEKKTVVVRSKLTGHSGDGIIIVEPLSAEMPAAPLYTKYVFKEKEFRVHVVNGQVVDTQRKIKDPDREVKSWKVRSHENGFIYVRGNIDDDPARSSLAIAATQALELDFGAVDIIQDKNGELYVLEINTAPGLEGQTVINYAEAFRSSYGAN